MQTWHEQTVFKRSVDEYPWSTDLTARPAVQYTYTDAIIRTGRDRMSLWLYSQHPLINVTKTVKLAVPVQWPELCKDAQLFTLLLIICVHVCLCILCRVFYCALSGRLVLLINWLIDWLIVFINRQIAAIYSACQRVTLSRNSVRPSARLSVALSIWTTAQGHTLSGFRRQISAALSRLRSVLHSLPHETNMYSFSSTTVIL